MAIPYYPSVPNLTIGLGIASLARLPLSNHSVVDSRQKYAHSFVKAISRVTPSNGGMETMVLGDNTCAKDTTI